MNMLAASVAGVAIIWVSWLIVRVRTEHFAVIIVVAMFVTRPYAEIGDFAIRFEVFVGLLVGVRLFARREGRPLEQKPRVAVFLVLSWLIVSVLTASFVALEPIKSLSLIAWTASSLMVAIWIAKNPSAWRTLFMAGAIGTVVYGLLGILFWAAALAGFGTTGVQVDPAYGGYAAYAFSLEANLFAGVICLWSIVTIANPMGFVPGAIRRTVFVVSPCAILASHTRAALIAYGVGLAALLILRKGGISGIKVLAPVGAVAAYFAAPSLGADVGLTKFGELFDVSGGTGGQRVSLSTTAVDEWLHRGGLYFGYGFNSFGQSHIDPTLPGQLAPAYVGNLPVQIAYDGGIFALGLVSVAALFGVWHAIRRGRASLVIAVGVPYLLLSVSTSALWLLETWVFVGLCLAGESSTETVHSVDDQRVYA